MPSFLKPSTRINWLYFPESLRNEVNLYLNWCKQSGEFSLDSRDRALAPASIVSVEEKVRAAANALVRNGVDPNVISSLKFLTAPESVLQILQWRKGHFGRENRQTFYIAAALVQIAREWVKADETTLTELKRLLSKIPHPAGDMTEKNKERLRQFDDPLVLHRLFSLPERMWVEVLADQNPNIRTLALAQTSITLALLPNVPLRPKNLASLEFDRHLFLRTKAGSISALEIPGVEMKGHEPQSYDIPLYVAKMMITYRDKIAPMVIGHRPKYLFSNVDGTPKCQDTVAYLITTHLKRRAGIVLNPHAFRHLAGKLFLDSKPGGYETVRQLLGHKKMSTTVQFYTGQSTRRASRYHQQIIESSRPKVGSKSRQEPRRFCRRAQNTKPHAAVPVVAVTRSICLGLQIFC